MKTNQINKLIKHIVRESLDMLEAHQEGSWWIDDNGELQSSGGEEKMKTEQWKRIKASAEKIEVFTWELKAEDLRIIIKGIEKIMGVESTEDDDDAVVAGDGYTGPRVDITIVPKNKKFKRVPFAILKKCLPSAMRNYEKGKEPDLAGPVNEEKSFHHLHKGYRLYEGHNHIIALFEDNSRLVFEVHFHENRGEDREKHRRKAFTTWKSVANEIYRDVQLTEVGNPIQKTWKQAFQEALKHPKLKDYIRKPHHQKVFDKG